MPSRKNNWLFLVALAAFLIITPALILSAQGFQWNSERRTLERIGGLYIEAGPGQAIVTVSQAGEPIRTSRVDRLINNLFPGEYDVVIAADGYTTWSRPLKVEPARVARVEGVVLLPTHPSAELVARLPAIQTLNIEPQGEMAIAQTTADQYYLLDLKSDRLWRLAGQGAPLPGFNTESAIWASTSPPAFWALAGERLNVYAFDPVSGRLTAEAVAEDVSAFDVFENSLWALSLKAKTVKAIGPNGERRPGAAIAALPAAVGSARLKIIDRESALLLIDGDLQKVDLISGVTESIASAVTAFASHHGDSDQIIYAVKKSLLAASLSGHRPAYPLLTNLADPAQKISWLKDGRHALILHSQAITFLETGPAEPRYRAQLSSNLRPLAFLPKTSRLFAEMIYDDNRRGLFSVEL